MNLFINSPAYYTNRHGVCDEIYKMCSLISQNIDVTKYTDYLDTIGILPLVAPKNILASGNYKEVKKISISCRFASISLVSDYNEYVSADINGKKDIITDNILRSLYVIKKSLKNNFDFDKIKEDIIFVLNNNIIS